MFFQTYFKLFLFVAVDGIFSKDVFNPNGPEYEGINGAYTYAIFASVSVTHSKARELCSLYYDGGTLAWLSDLKVSSLRAVADQALVFHYMNGNNYFWIDGTPHDENCSPENSSCRWVTNKQSLLSYFTDGSFYNNGTACHTEKSDLSREQEEDRQFWPVLVPNANEELGWKKTFVVSAVPGYAKGGFICAHDSKINPCPYGFSEAPEVAIPDHLIPENTSSEDLCLQ